MRRVGMKVRTDRPAHALLDRGCRDLQVPVAMLVASSPRRWVVAHTGFAEYPHHPGDGVGNVIAMGCNHDDAWREGACQSVTRAWVCHVEQPGWVHWQHQRDRAADREM